jgi:hypothetical protein
MIPFRTIPQSHSDGPRRNRQSVKSGFTTQIPPEFPFYPRALAAGEAEVEEYVTA